ncbi:MAG: serine protease [Pseudomonadota bacterium]
MKVKFITLALLSACVGLQALAAAPTPELQKKVRAATFEVVVPKPAETGVTYERPLPLELIPFVERNDRYWPIGTAFAIGADTFVTAAHVLRGALGGAGGPPVLRGADGKIVAIVSVLKFSAHQDFAVFKTGAAAASQVLETSNATTIDEPVFAVGNALGEGVVIRDGLLTSLTPEDQDGRWKWLRYSAATSPGNSGGPLLNGAGAVIGVVIGKSPGENLNYALPIEYVTGAPMEARVDVRATLRLPVLREPLVATFASTVPLPLPLADFEKRMRAESLRMYREQRARLLAQNQAALLPRGKGDKLLASVTAAYCPALIVQGKDGAWDVDDNSRTTEELPDDGSFCTRVAGEVPVFEIDRGKNTEPRFYEDPRFAMDLLLKGAQFRRMVGSESVIVTSLGAAKRNIEHRDRFGRRWRIATFGMPYLDADIVLAMLPTPRGYSGILQVVERGGEELAREQLTFLSDYFYLSYSGTLAQWHAFLARPDLRATAFDKVTLARDVDGMHFRSRRLDFDLPPGLMKLDDQAVVKLQMSYALEGDQLIWDIGAIYVSTDEDDKMFVGLIRQPKPASGAGKGLNERWQQILDGKGDFSSERGHDSDYKKFWRRAAVDSTYRPGASVNRAATLFYEALSTINDAKLPGAIDTMHDLLLENVRVKEK